MHGVEPVLVGSRLPRLLSADAGLVHASPSCSRKLAQAICLLFNAGDSVAGMVCHCRVTMRSSKGCEQFGASLLWTAASAWRLTTAASVLFGLPLAVDVRPPMRLRASHSCVSSGSWRLACTVVVSCPPGEVRPCQVTPWQLTTTRHFLALPLRFWSFSWCPALQMSSALGPHLVRTGLHCTEMGQRA